MLAVLRRARFRAAAIVLFGGVVGAGWYWFRPERALIDVRVAEAPPDTGATVVARGSFVPVAHEGAGAATLLRLPDGTHLLRFTAFKTLNGPDVRVYLLGADRIEGNVQLRAAGYLDLGALKGNVGDQNYDLPAAVDLTRYRAVAVWCRRFGVNFTTAVLAPPSPSDD
jgi:hypothetical protein